MSLPQHFRTPDTYGLTQASRTQKKNKKISKRARKASKTEAKENESYRNTMDKLLPSLDQFIETLFSKNITIASGSSPDQETSINDQTPASCHCNHSLRKTSVESLYSLFAAIFGIKLVRLQMSNDSKQVSKQFFGKQRGGDRHHILEWSIFSPKYQVIKTKLEKKLKKREKNKELENYSKILRLKDALQKLNDLRQTPKHNRFYLCELKGASDVLKGVNPNIEFKGSSSKAI